MASGHGSSGRGRFGARDFTAEARKIGRATRWRIAAVRSIARGSTRKAVEGAEVAVAGGLTLARARGLGRRCVRAAARRIRRERRRRGAGERGSLRIPVTDHRGGCPRTCLRPRRGRTPPRLLVSSFSRRERRDGAVAAWILRAARAIDRTVAPRHRACPDPFRAFPSFRAPPRAIDRTAADCHPACPSDLPRFRGEKGGRQDAVDPPSPGEPPSRLPPHALRDLRASAVNQGIAKTASIRRAPASHHRATPSVTSAPPW